MLLCTVVVSGTVSPILNAHREREKFKKVKAAATLVEYRIALLLDQHIFLAAFIRVTIKHITNTGT